MSNIKGFDPSTKGLEEVTTTVSGDRTLLDVKVVGSGGGAASATEAKQDTQITELQAIKDAKTVNVDWDYYDLTYVTVGNGLGEIETITYFTGTTGSGTQVLLITVTYDVAGEIVRVVRT